MDTPAKLPLGGPDQISLSLLNGDYSVCKLQPGSDPGALHPGIRSITMTDRETSLVCTTGQEPEGAIIESGWRALYVNGPIPSGSPASSPASRPPSLPPDFRFL